MNSTEQTVAVQKAIGATKALVSIANGAPWSVYQQLETDTRGIVTERMAQTILDALQAAPQLPPADSEDRQLAAIARRIAACIEVYELPRSGTPVFEYRSANGKNGGVLNEAFRDPLMESLRQLALWKAGQQVAEAGEQKYTGDESVDNEIAGLDLILHNETFRLKERIAELEAEVARLQGERDSAVKWGNKLTVTLSQIVNVARASRPTIANDPVLNNIIKKGESVLLIPSAPESEATDA